GGAAQRAAAVHGTDGRPGPALRPRQGRRAEPSAAPRLPRVAGVGVGVPYADPPPHGPGPARRRSRRRLHGRGALAARLRLLLPTEPAPLRRPRDRRALP